MTTFVEHWQPIGRGFRLDSVHETQGGRLGLSLQSVKRKAGLLPPKARAFLASRGDTVVTRLVVCRTPLSNATKALLSAISFGQFEKAVRGSSYDSLFHLALVINDSVTLDKREVVKLEAGSPVRPNSEVLPVPAVPAGLTIHALVEKTRQGMGDVQFTGYDARTNNCQAFVRAVLFYNGMLSAPLQAFVVQDADSVFRRLPSFVEKIGRFVTDVGAVADKVLEGEGSCNTCVKKNPTKQKMMSYRDFVRQEMKKRPAGTKVTAYMSTIAKKWKEHKAGKK